MPNSNITQFASDVDNKVLYVLDNVGIKSLDLASGNLTPVATLTSTSNLTFGATALFTVPSLSPYLLKRVNPTNGAIADLGATNLSGIQAVAYDAVGGTILATRWATSGPELQRLSASTGMATVVGPVAFDPMALPPGNSRIGLAIEPVSGGVYAATADGRTPQFLFTQHCTQVVDDGFKDASSQPALGLLIDSRPGWQVMRHHPPLRPRSDYPAQPVDHFPHTMFPLRRIFPHQRQIRCYKCPFIVTHITRVWFPVHHSSLSKVHNRL